MAMSFFRCNNMSLSFGWRGRTALQSHGGLCSLEIHVRRHAKCTRMHSVIVLLDYLWQMGTSLPLDWEIVQHSILLKQFSQRLHKTLSHACLDVVVFCKIMIGFFVYLYHRFSCEVSKNVQNNRKFTNNVV